MYSSPTPATTGRETSSSMRRRLVRAGQPERQFGRHWVDRLLPLFSDGMGTGTRQSIALGLQPDFQRSRLWGRRQPDWIGNDLQPGGETRRFSISSLSANACRPYVHGGWGNMATLGTHGQPGSYRRADVQCTGIFPSNANPILTLSGDHSGGVAGPGIVFTKTGDGAMYLANAGNNLRQRRFGHRNPARSPRLQQQPRRSALEQCHQLERHPGFAGLRATGGTLLIPLSISTNDDQSVRYHAGQRHRSGTHTTLTLNSPFGGTGALTKGDFGTLVLNGQTMERGRGR